MKNNLPAPKKQQPTGVSERCHNLGDSNLFKTRTPPGFILCTRCGLKLWVKLNSKRLKKFPADGEGKPGEAQGWTVDPGDPAAPRHRERI